MCTQSTATFLRFDSLPNPYFTLDAQRTPPSPPIRRLYNVNETPATVLTRSEINGALEQVDVSAPSPRDESLGIDGSCFFRDEFCYLEGEWGWVSP
jgi:hypothetical protein